MPWHTQRLNRPKGFYYSAIFTPQPGNGEKRTICIGFLPRPGSEVAGAPEPSLLTALLRAHDPQGTWADAAVVEALSLRGSGGSEEEAVKAATVIAFLSGPVEAHPVPLPSTSPSTSTPSQIASPAPKGATSGGGMLLRDFVQKIWIPLLKSRVKITRSPIWWWEKRILPALGDTKLVDLNPKKWSDFLAGLTISGPSKHLAQTTYRTALSHAEELGWISQVHKFPTIPGGSKRATPEAEPMSMEEVEIFLSVVTKPKYRALFGVQVGLGLRPSEAIRIRWEDVDWQKGTLFVRGTKTDLARATLPLTPLAKRELLSWWVRQGKPTEGVLIPGLGDRGLKNYPITIFHKYAAKSGLNEDRARQLFPYICRHSFATIAAVSGIDRAFTKDMMRHSRQSKVLDEAYIKVSKAQTATAFAGFGSR